MEEEIQHSSMQKRLNKEICVSRVSSLISNIPTYNQLFLQVFFLSVLGIDVFMSEIKKPVSLSKFLKLSNKSLKTKR